MKLRLALAAATCLALPLAAHAQPVTGPYVSLAGGTNIMDTQNYQYVINSAQQGKFLFRPSYAGVVGFGYGLGNGLRIELDGNFYRNTIHKQNDNQLGGLRMTGGVNTYGGVANIIYDISTGSAFTPYVGVGGGYEIQQFEHLSNGAAGDVYSGSQGGAAFDVLGGVAYAIPSVPGLSATVEARFMQITGKRTYHDYPGGDSITINGSSNYTFLAGLRYALFSPPMMAPAPAPAPAPMAAPAPAPARTYLVFFDWDKSNLTPRATQIIAQAASDSKTTTTTTLSVSGYTDTSGTPTYNQELSERRAKTVAAQLVTDGVPASEIEIHAFGETHLLVPTGPGVREPQNRRVEIVLK
ncbi:MAG: OmpA family protein [Acidocella sp.]|nr:OmpA family protein [Acidocella sp.]